MQVSDNVQMLADQCWWSTFILSVGGISVNSTGVPGWLPQHFMYMYPNSWSLVNITWMWQQREVSWLTFPHFPNPIPDYGRSARQWDWRTKWYELILYCVIVVFYFVVYRSDLVCWLFVSSCDFLNFASCKSVWNQLYHPVAFQNFAL